MDLETIIEVKCSYKQYVTKKPFSALACDPKFCLANENGILSLKMDHSYYHQIQGNLYATNRKYCDFFMWSPHEFFLQKVEKDLNWHRNVIGLEKFYFNQFLPTIFSELKSKEE